MIENNTTITSNSNFDISEHRVSGNWDPSKYTFVEHFDNSYTNCEAVDPIDAHYLDVFQNQGLSIDHCTHCGKSLVRGNIFVHENGDYAIFGQTCTSRLAFETPEEFFQARKEQAIYRAAIRKLISKDPKLAPIVEGLQKVVANEEGNYNEWSVNTARDLLDKLAAHKQFRSQKQQDFATRLPQIAEDQVEKDKLRNQRIAERKKRDALSQWVGGVKERRDWLLTLEAEFGFETDFGHLSIKIFRDDDGNVIVYKGSIGSFVDPSDEDKVLQKGGKIRLKATIKSHEVRKEVKQTLISRPKVLEVL